LNRIPVNRAVVMMLIYIETYAVLSLYSFYAIESPNLSLSHLEMVTKTKIQSNLSILFKRCSTVASENFRAMIIDIEKLLEI